MDFRTWYDTLAKPSWTPPVSAIGTIWTILYPIIFGATAYVFYKAFRGELPRSLMAPFGISLALNLLFTPIQFGLRNLDLAAIEVVFLWLSIIWCMIATYKHVPLITYAFIPYLLWVTIASTLQISIALMN